MIELILAALSTMSLVQPQAASSSDENSLSHEVQLTKADPLISYSWDQGPKVLAPQAAESPSPLKIPFGEAGISSDTVLYMPFHGTHPVIAALIPKNTFVAAAGTLISAGPFGSAFEFQNQQSGISISSRSDMLLGDTWSLDFWVRLPEQLQKITLLSAPEKFDVLLSKDGHMRVAVHAGPTFRLKSKAKALLGQWNHVGLTMEGPELRQFRFSLNGAAQGKLVQQTFATNSLEFGNFIGAIDELRIVDYPATSAEFAERWERKLSSGPHELTLTYADRTETLEFWAGKIEQPVLQGNLWSQGQLEHALADDTGLRWTPGHWTRYRTEHGPVPRTTHPTVYVGKQRVFIFGGETRDSNVGGMVNTDDTWIFHTDTGVWNRSTSELSPPPSCHQSAAYSPDHGVVLYAGGQYNERDEFWLYDQTWLYFVDEDRWEKREPSGAKLPKTADGVVVYHPLLRQFMLLGSGFVYLYDPEANSWKRMPKSTAVTSSGESITYTPGGSPMVGYDPQNDQMVFYGGAHREDEGMIWKDLTTFFDLGEMKHTLLDTPVSPPGRVRAGFAYDSKRARFVMFGGVLDQMSQRKSDLWSFDPETKAWTAMEDSNAPSERGGFYHMAYDPDLDRFILLCGRREPLVFSNEAWALHLDETATGTARYVFDRSAFPNMDQWFAEWDQPEGAKVSFRFRAGTDANSWGAWSPAIEEAAGGNAPLVQVEVELIPGEQGGVPSLQRMGFRMTSEAESPVGQESKRSSASIAPLTDK